LDTNGRPISTALVARTPDSSIATAHGVYQLQMKFALASA